MGKGMNLKATKARRIGRLLQISVLALVFSGCTTIYDFKIDPVAEYSQRNKIGLGIELRLTDEFCNYAWERKVFVDTYRLPLGSTLSENAEIVTREVFKDVVVTKGGTKALKANVVAVLMPKVTSVERSPIMRAWEIAETIIYIEWNLTNLQGEVIWVSTIKGVGRAKQGIYLNLKKQTQKQVQKAVEDLFLKTFDAMSSSPEIREFAATH